MKNNNGSPKLRRRSVIAAPAALAAGSLLARPHIARAAATTLTLWWNQGLYQAEEHAFRDTVRAWEKASGNRVELSFVPTTILDSKTVAAMTNGPAPDIIYDEGGAGKIFPQYAWAGKFVDVSDVVMTQRDAYSPAALRAAHLYDNVEKKRGYYAVPLSAKTLNIPVWKTLIEKAGYQVSDLPKTWDAYFNFFKGVQKRLRKAGMRHVYGLGFTLSTVDDDTVDDFNQFLVAYGGGGIVTPDGKLHVDDPKVREAAIKAITALTTPYKEGYVPRGAITWDGPDNNVAFHSKEVVMTLNYTISISTAVMKNKQLYYKDIITSPMPLDNAGKPVPSLIEVMLAVIPKGAKNVEVAKDFLRYLIQPAHLDSYLKQARGRFLPVMPPIVKDDPYWLDPADPHRSVAVRQGVLGPTATWFYCFNPGYAQVNAEQVWGVAEADVINGMAPDKAVDKAFAHIRRIFAKYPIG